MGNRIARTSVRCSLSPLPCKASARATSEIRCTKVMSAFSHLKGSLPHAKMTEHPDERSQDRPRVYQDQLGCDRQTNEIRASLDGGATPLRKSVGQEVPSLSCHRAHNGVRRRRNFSRSPSCPMPACKKVLIRRGSPPHK